MKLKFPVFPFFISCLGLIALILDSKTAAKSAESAIALCIQTVIPSLFPLFVLSGVMVSILSGLTLPGLGRICKIPSGCEGIFLLGIIGGFPMGAQCIAQSVEQNCLQPEDGRRMLGFCNNCGPAFLFGILGGLFSDPLAPLALLLIQLESALAVAIFWPGKIHRGKSIPAKEISFPKAVNRAIRSMASVCAWVILAKVVLGFLNRWLFPFLPTWLCVILSGILELTSGCLCLSQIQSEPLRFLICCGFICFGGICVHLQIQGIAHDQSLYTGPCVLQKILQAAVSVVLGASYLKRSFWSLLIPIFLGPILKIAVEKTKFLVYNISNKGGIAQCSFVRKSRVPVSTASLEPN